MATSKMDRQGSRTPAQTEQRYGFGKKFAEAFGLAEEAQDAAEQAQKNAGAAADALDKKLTPEELFNRLTNNGQAQGLYRDEDGNIYINASYIKAGELIADLIKSGVLTSKDGSTQFNLDKDEIVCADSSGHSTTIRDGSILVTDGSSDIDIVNGMMIFTNDSKLLGYIHGYTGRLVFDGGEIQCPRINPGKKLLYEGTVSKGSSFTVPNTTDYDLFAIRLDDSTYVVPYIVLAYKRGGCIRGVGGWAGDASTSKELSFVNITYSGDTWTLVDANKQGLYGGGGTTAATSLTLTEVIGVI